MSVENMAAQTEVSENMAAQTEVSENMSTQTEVSENMSAQTEFSEKMSSETVSESECHLRPESVRCYIASFKSQLQKQSVRECQLKMNQ